MTELRLERFEPSTAPEADWEAYFALHEALRRELRPRDPLPSRALARRWLTDPGPHRAFVRWLARDGSAVLGYGHLSYATECAPSYERNRHLAGVHVAVDPERRRKGAGTALLARAAALARERGRTVLEAETFHDGARAFCARWGAQVTIEAAESRLYLDEADWERVFRWCRQVPRRAPGVRVERFSSVPEADLEAYCALYTEVMNQQPLGGIEYRPRMTPESRRLDERRLRDKGFVWITLVTREPDGALSGLTEIDYHPEEPHHAHQLLTGVREASRGRGLGKWLKALMLCHLRDRFPELRFVATGNADVNAPMLSINRRLGFKRYLTETAFKWEVAALCRRLGVG